MREDQHGAGDQEATVEVRLEADADGDGERDNQSSDRNVSQGQRDDETKRGVPERAVNAHSPHHHHVAHHGRQRHDRLHQHVEGFRGG